MDTVTGQRLCFASPEFEAIVECLREQWSAIQRGEVCAELSGGNGPIVLVSLHADQALNALEGLPLHTSLHAHK